MAQWHPASANSSPTSIYSHVGRGPGGYGAPITLTHRYAIAFAVEMNHAMISAAPRIPAVMESAREYVEAGKIAVILAAAIRNLGYPARGAYRRQLPGDRAPRGQRRRSGRDRQDGAIDDPEPWPAGPPGRGHNRPPADHRPTTFNPAVIDFCDHCQKCVEVCPSEAIPAGGRTEYPDDTLRWKIDSEQCFTYWTQIGTDCGRCMAVCPTLIPIRHSTT